MTGTTISCLLVTAIVLAAFSGVPLILRLQSPRSGQRVATLLILAATVCGLTGAIYALFSRATVTWTLPGAFPFSPTVLGIDPLSAFFIIPILIVAACCSIYSLDYWPADSNPRTIYKVIFFFGILVASMLLVTLARSAGIFLLAWEVMALAAYFMVTTDDHKPTVRDSGTVYLICTHTGTLSLFAFFSILNSVSGGFKFPPTASISATAPMTTIIFILAVFGFGFKAGLMPLHIWLPAAHANAPSHVSAIMSGVILKIGIYGLVRSISFFNTIPLWWGMVLLILGIISGVFGVLFAIGQHDIKRLLAYHSIENIGIIFMGLGVAVIGISKDSPTLVLLGMAGALLHVFNHAIFKALLFLCAGSVIHAIGTRELKKMGGLLRKLPLTSVAFLTGAVAICGLPPLNGFVSEFLIYLGFFNGAIFQEGTETYIFAIAAPVLALIGGLAIACFVKVFGVVFLGSPRSIESEHIREAGIMMRIPMIILSFICFAVGVLPVIVAPLLQSAISSFLPLNAPLPTLTRNAPFSSISILAAVIIIVAVVLISRYLKKLDRTEVKYGSTWGCGYLAPTSRMQYTAASFAAMLVNLFSGILRPEQQNPNITGVFPSAAHFESHQPETIFDKIYIPFFSWAYTKFLPIRHLQHGHLHIYILYTVITLLLLIAVSI